MGFQNLIQKYEGNTVLRVIVNLIPHVGGSLDVALSRWSQIRQERVDDLLDDIREELAGVREEEYKKEYLYSEDFYDLVYQIVNNALTNRCPETRRAYAKVIKSAVLNEETTANLEDIIRQVEGIKEKDIFFLRATKNVLCSGRNLTGRSLAMRVSVEGGTYDSLESERMLYRFENLGLLDHPRNMMVGPGTMAFQKLPLFDKVVMYLGL